MSTSNRMDLQTLGSQPGTVFFYRRKKANILHGKVGFSHQWEIKEHFIFYIARNLVDVR